MKSLFRFLPVILVLVTACNNNSEKAAGTTTNADDAFGKLSDDYLNGYLAWRPQQAVGLGFHEYDGKVTDYSKASIDAELKRLKDFEQKLSMLDTTGLSPKMFYDYRILRLAIQSDIYNIED